MIKINSLDKSFKFDGKILRKNGKRYNGNFVSDLSEGKKVALKYENGLLKHASLYDGEKVQFKTYNYDNDDRLINIKKNNKDVFVKEIKHNIGKEYTREEIINNVISRTFDSKNRVIRYVISPKLIFSFMKYLEDLSVETRYFLNLAQYMGNGHIRLKYNCGDPIINNGVVDKTIIRMKNGARSVISKDGTHLQGKYVNPVTNTEYNFLLKNNEQDMPVIECISDNKNKKIYDLETCFDISGNKKIETIYKNNGKNILENVFDKKGNITISRKLNSLFQEVQRTEYKYNEQNLIAKELTFNRDNKLIEEKNNIYYPDNKIKISEITYFDSMGSYKNIYEYNPKGKIKKLTEIYNNADLKFETYYDYKGNEKLFIEKDFKDNIKMVKRYICKGYDKIKTIVKDANNNEKYHIDHIHSIKDEIMKDINIYKSPNQDLLGKEFVIHDNVTGITKSIYINSNGKRVSREVLCKIISDDI